MENEEQVKEEIIKKLEEAAVDSHTIIESGWNALKAVCLKDAPEFQIKEMRKAYFAGAQHLYAILMSCVSPGTEPTQRDFQIMEDVHKELIVFYNALKGDLNNTKEKL